MPDALKFIIMSATCLLAFASQVVSATTQIEADTTWSGDKTVEDKVLVVKGTLTIEAGAKITFKPGGEINVRSGATLVAKGIDAKPIEFIGGDKTGTIYAEDGSILLERCHLTGLAGPWSSRPVCMFANCGKGGVTLRNCTFTDCGAAWVTANNGPFEMTGCDFRRRADLYTGDNGMFTIGGDSSTITLVDNTFSNVTPYSSGGKSQTVIRGNIFVNCAPVGFLAPGTLVEENYIHQPLLNSTYGLLNVAGTIRNNVVRGGTWTMCGLGGTITGNVIEAMSPEDIKKSAEAGFKDSTHENFGGVKPGSIIERNIILNASFGAVMGAADNSCSDCTIRNNTFDLRGGTSPVWLNHLVKVKPKNIVIRNNMFLRTGRMYDEAETADSISYADYNLWAGTKTDSPSAGSQYTSKRYAKITLTGKKEGDDGFSGHDVFIAPEAGKPFDAKTFVEDPEFALKFSDEDMLARKHTVKECLELYRKAYTPKTHSPAIDAGSPADAKDPAVKDGKCDIGAIEYGVSTTMPATTTAAWK